MEKVFFESMTQMRGRPVDCNWLYLEVEYHRASVAQVYEAISSFISGINDFHNGQMITLWTQINDFGTASIPEKKLPEVLGDFKKPLQLVFEANCRSPLVTDKTSFKRFLNGPFFGETHPFHALDFPQYYHAKIKPMIDDAASLKAAIIEMFSEAPRKQFGYYSQCDAGGDLDVLPYRSGHKEQFHGMLSYTICVSCCRRRLDAAAEYLGALLLRVCESLRDANGRIGICPWTTNRPLNNYMTYFGSGEVRGDGSHTEEDCQPDEWYPYYYLSGLGWMNVLSPLAAKHLRPMPPVLQPEQRFHISKTSCGGSVIRSAKGLEETGFAEYSDMKQYLYPALYPGESVFEIMRPGPRGFHYDAFPGCRWNTIPLTPDELAVDRKHIRFQKAESIRPTIKSQDPKAEKL